MPSAINWQNILAANDAWEGFLDVFEVLMYLERSLAGEVFVAKLAFFCYCVSILGHAWQVWNWVWIASSFLGDHRKFHPWHDWCLCCMLWRPWWNLSSSRTGVLELMWQTNTPQCILMFSQLSELILGPLPSWCWGNRRFFLRSRGFSEKRWGLTHQAARLLVWGNQRVVRNLFFNCCAGARWCVGDNGVRMPLHRRSAFRGCSRWKSQPRRWHYSYRTK